MLCVVQDDEIDPASLVANCSLGEARYLLERCVTLIVSKVSCSLSCVRPAAFASYGSFFYYEVVKLMLV
jgi:hypothetical protein